MGDSKVTDFMIGYLRENGISAEWAAAVCGIPQEKIMDGYTEPLATEEFLTLCVRLLISPEEVADAIRSGQDVASAPRTASGEPGL